MCSLSKAEGQRAPHKLTLMLILMETRAHNEIWREAHEKLNSAATAQLNNFSRASLPKLIHTALHTGTSRHVPQPAMVGPDCVPFPRSTLRSTTMGAPVAVAAESGRRLHPAHVQHWSSLLGSR